MFECNPYRQQSRPRKHTAGQLDALKCPEGPRSFSARWEHLHFRHGSYSEQKVHRVSCTAQKRTQWLCCERTKHHRVPDRVRVLGGNVPERVFGPDIGSSLTDHKRQTSKRPLRWVAASVMRWAGRARMKAEPRRRQSDRTHTPYWTQSCKKYSSLWLKEATLQHKNDL